MTLKELRISKRLTQVDASEICHIPLRSYKRIESDVSYANSYKYKNAVKCLENYHLNKNKDKSHNVLVIGAGYVGFSLAVLLSKTNDVTIVDIKEDKVNKINSREPIFKDKEIAQWLETKELHLKASLPNKELYKNQDYIIVALPTDYDEKTNLLKTDNIVSLVKEIREINKKTLIVIKSTCYVGFTESLNDNNVIFCPEFLREGRALLDNLYPSRIIIGGDPSNKKIKEFGDLLAKLSLNRAKTLYMSAKEAEAVKLFSNAYLALRVAYFNELDSFAMTNEMNSKNIIEGVSLDNRIGDYYNNPSFGYGGYCLPKDTLSLINQMNDVKNKSLISSIDQSNMTRKELIVDDIVTKLKRMNGHVVGVYSMESKKDSDNIRHAAILDVIKGLEKLGVNILYYSPDISLESFKEESDIILVNRYDSSLDDVKDKIYTRDVYRRD